MTNFCISFEKLDVATPNETSRGKIMPGSEHVNVHMICEINMDGKFTRKSRLVADGHKIAPSSLITH